MNRLLLSFLSILFFNFLSAQGWRQAEKQIVITLQNQEEAKIITAMHLSFDDLGPNQIRAYVIPDEILTLEKSGINYQMEIEDLNKYSQLMQLTDENWHSYQQIIELADSLENAFPDICKKYSFGTSLGGRQLAALKISDNVEIDENEAEIVFDGGIHGDEYCGAENIIRFARDLCIGYNEDPDITFVINNRETWLYLMVNPDGRVNVVRYNNNGVDLNRDWGYMWNGEGYSPGAFSQVESKALRACMYTNQFVVHTSYHGGTEFISLPWSYRSNQPPDWNQTFQLAGVYSTTSTYSNLTYGQGNTGMYPINGSTKDANYGIMGCVTWSLEISNQKMPPTSQIMLYYNRNYPAMLAMLEYAGYGLEGVITDAVSGDAVAGAVFINNYFPSYSDPSVGDYHKYVLPGTYSITVVANGYETQTIDNLVVTANSSTATNFQLQPSENHFVYRFASSQIPNNNEADEGNTMAVIGAPDDINYSIGKSGWVVLDMQYPVIEGPGSDFIVYEGDNSPEGYSCFASETMDGPWMSLGSGMGTTEFDLALSELPEAQFIKLVDDGDGNANVADAGFDLDAIEALAPVSGVYISMYDVELDDSNGNNNGRIDPGETVNIIVTLKNNGDIIAENLNGDLSSTSPYIEFVNYTATYGSLGQGQSAQGTYTLTANANTPIGQVAQFELEVNANSGAYSNTFSMAFTIGLIMEDWESGNFEQYDWVVGGSLPWSISTTNPYEGIYCVKSGTISHNQTSYLSISYEIFNSSEISFYKKVSSEASYDFLKFYIDGSVQDQWSGEVAWSQSSFAVGSGTHTFMWEYSKDGSVSSGSDAAWVDNIVLPAGALQSLMALFNADQTDICEGSVVAYTDNSIGDIISWSWEFEGGSPASSSTQNPSVAYFNAGVFDVSLTINDGTDTQTLLLTNYISVDYVPETPTMPEGPSTAASIPGETYTYIIDNIANADNYVWEYTPTNAVESFENNGIECIIDFTDYYNGDVSLKVKAVNDCGEGEFSDEKTIYVMIEGVDNSVENSIQLFPNPTNSKLSVQMNKISGEKVNIQLVNTLGNVVNHWNDYQVEKDNSLVLDLTDQPSGIYYLIISNDNLQIRKKLIKQN